LKKVLYIFALKKIVFMTLKALNIWNVLKIVIALFMIFAGVQHFINANFFIPYVPSFLPLKMTIIYVSGLFEILVGLFLFTKKYASYGAIGALVLLLLFLPIHIWDVITETPAIGSKQAALIRLPIQFLLIFIVWKIKKSISQNKLAL